jgi:hypothetical protein
LKGLLNFFRLCLVLLSLPACSGIAVRGSVDGQAIETRVDSEVARYYLENYLAGKRVDARLDERIDRVYQSADGKLPDSAELKRLSEEFSVDFAALYFADRIAQVPGNQTFRSAFDRIYDFTRTALPQGHARLPAEAAKYEALVVPSYLYKRKLANGAALTASREALAKVDFPCYFVETADDGPVESNAELVMAAIRARARDGRRLIVISASKSGAEVALALTKLGAAETGHVAAWINAVGALKGTPMVDDGIVAELEIIVGKVDPDGMVSMTTAVGRQRFNSFDVPKPVFVVNLIAIPFSGSVGFRASRGYFPMRKHGPTDGVVPLADTIYPGGVTLAQVGSDHFLMYNLDITTVALVSTIISWLENPRGDADVAREPKGPRAAP